MYEMTQKHNKPQVYDECFGHSSYTTLQIPQVQRSSLEETMVELERGHAELAMTYAEFSRSMAEMDYSQVGLPRFLDQNEKSQPPHGRMTNLEGTIAKLERLHVECPTSQALLMKEVNTPLQDESIVEKEVDKLALTMAKLTMSKAELIMDETKSNDQILPIPLKSLEKEMPPMVTSCTQSTIER